MSTPKKTNKMHIVTRKFACVSVLLLCIFLFCSSDLKIYRIPSLLLQDRIFSLIWKPQESPDAVLVCVDDKSLQAFHQWPFPRILHSCVQKNLSDAGAKTVVWDMVFPDEDRYSPKNLKQFFADFFNETITTSDSLPDDFDFYFLRELSRNGIIGTTLGQPSRYDKIPHGHILVTPDIDDRIRSIHLSYFSDGKPVPSLGLLAAMHASDQTDAFRTGFQSAGRYIHTSDVLSLRPWKVPMLSYLDVFYKNFDPKSVQGKTVFIGATDRSLNDIKMFPSGRLPGVFAHIMTFEELMHGPVVLLASEYNALLGISLALLLFLLLSHITPDKTGKTSGLFLSICLVCVYSFCISRKIYIDVLPLILSVVAVAVYNYLFAIYEEHAKILKIQRYMAPEIATVLLENNTTFMEGEERDISVLFSDLRGFTSLSENLHPRDVQRLLNALFTPISRIIRNHEGIVDKYVGDEVMAVWNAPLDVAEHPQKALDAAFAMLEVLPSIEKSLPANVLQGKHLRCGIGINVGNAFVGDMGSTDACSYTSLGRTVNLASRIEHACPEYGTDILVSEAFMQRFIQWSKYRFLLIDIIQVKGIQLPQVIYQPIIFDNGNQDETEAVEGWLEMERLFREGLIRDAGKRGEEALANGWFEKTFQDRNPGNRNLCPQTLFLESLLAKNQLWVNGKYQEKSLS